MTTTAPSIPATPTPAAALLVSARLRALGYALLAALAYIPVMLTSPGRVVADTKSYLYLDPSRLLERAPSMWDPNIGLGTVTHQNIGYLFPMGPYYWLMDALGFPAWVSQRLWLGTILLAAGLGVLYLMRTLAVRGPGVPVAALVFMLTPYSLDFASRISVILLPWAALPWMVAIMVRALRDDRGWRYPAIFAIVVQVVGGVNATALIFAGIAPALWVLHAVYVTREIRVRRAFAVLAKVGLLTFLASLWWLAGLSIQSGYGLNVLRYTETLETVSTASLANEVLRGLGYWFFYGRDKLGPWTESSVGYTQHIWLILVGYAVPVLAIAGAALVRWKHRVFFVALVLVGVTVAVGAHPYDDPSPFGALFKSFAADSSFGLALRSTGRAVPLLVLGLAVLLGAAVNVVAERWAARDQASSRDGARIGRGRARGLVLAGVIGALAIANLPALWNGTFYGKNLQRDEDVPAYWTQAIGDLDAGPHDTRVLEIPGADFAAYRWGNTVDPITPGLMDRPYVARELIPWGSPASADLLNALDRRLQEGVLDPSAIAPVARLLGVGDVVYRADLQTDRFDLPRSRPTWLLLSDPVPAGLGTPKPYGDSLGPPLTFAQQDEVALALPPSSPEPAPVVVFPVEDAPSIVRTAAAGAPLLVSGDGEGLVDLAVLGALDGSRPVLYSASFAGDGAALRKQVDAPESTLVVTDSNRKRGRRWGAIKDVEGATERAGETALTKDEADNRLDVFPDASTDANTVVESPGARVSTTRYGNRITYWPEQRGARAFDGDVSTAWQVGTHAKAIGEKLRLDLDEPITTDHVNLVQRQVGDTRRSVTAVTLAFDGGDPVTVPLDDSSRTPDGQTVTFPRRTFRRLEVTIADTSDHDVLDGPVNNVGFAQIRVRDDGPGATDVRVDEIVRMPTDLVRHAPRSTVAERPLVYVMTRSRNVVIPPRDSQDEMALVRKFLVPNDRAFSYRGRARLATDAPDDVLDSLLGFPDAETGGITVTASQHLDGSVAARGSAALDGDPATAWNTKFGAPAGQWVDVRTPAPVTFDRLDLQVVADGRHSVPTQLRIDAGGESRTVDVPTVSDSTQENATATVPVTFAPLTGDDVRVTVTGLRPIVTTEYHELQPIVMPVGIAELGIPGVRRGPLPAALPDTCRTDLVALDGEPLPVRLDGSPADAQALQPVDLRACDGAPTAVDLAAGNHVVRSARGRDLGVDVDGLTLGSAAGGEPLVLGANGSFTPAPPSAGKGPSVRVVHNGRTKLELDVTGATPGDPFWLTLGQSQNAGWQATADGVDLGGSTLVDGYANGWRVTPTSAHFDVTLAWTPQRRVWIALGISAVALLLCLVLALRGLRHRRGTRESVAAAELPELTSPLVAAGDRPSVSALVAGTLTAGVLGAFLVRWWVGLVAAAAVLLVALRPRFRFLLTFGAPAALALSGLYVAVQQFRYEYVSDFGWPTNFERVHYLAWLAVILLASDAIVELVRTGWARPPSVPSADSVPAREPALPRDAASTPEPV